VVNNNNSLVFIETGVPVTEHLVERTDARKRTNEQTHTKHTRKKYKNDELSNRHYLGDRLCSAGILAAAGVHSSILWTSGKKLK